MERVFKLFDKKGDRCIDEDRFIHVLKVSCKKTIRNRSSLNGKFAVIVLSLLKEHDEVSHA